MGVLVFLTEILKSEMFSACSQAGFQPFSLVQFSVLFPLTGFFPFQEVVGYSPFSLQGLLGDGSWDVDALVPVHFEGELEAAVVPATGLSGRKRKLQFLLSYMAIPCFCRWPPPRRRAGTGTARVRPALPLCITLLP